MEDISESDRKIWTGRAASTRRRDLSAMPMQSGRESSANMSNKTFTSGMIAAASRPVTQQGMTGLRAPQTASGSNRQYHDKRYYMSQIQTHMLAIHDEINNLKRLLSEHRLDATNYEECKRQVDDLSKQLAGYEETLITYNTAIEISMFKGSKNDIDTDAEKLRRSNQQQIAHLESIFSDKIYREEKLAKLQQQSEVETQLFNDIVATFSEEKRQEYEELWQTNEQLKAQEEIIGSELRELRNTINSHEHHVVQNEQKRVRYNLMVKLDDLTNRREKIIEENKVKRSPSQEREYLLEQVKHDRADIESFKVQQEELNAELEKLRARNSELEEELSEKNSARINKFRELLKRQETMDAFLENYNEEHTEVAGKLNELQTQIVFALEYISGNSTDDNFEDLNKTQTFSVSPNATKEELQQEYKKLVTNIEMYESLKTRYTKQIMEIKETEEKYLDELVTYNNIDEARDNLIDRQNNLESQKESLKGVVNATKSAVTEAEKKKQEIETQLKFNDEYKAVKVLEEKLSELKVDNDKQKSAVENIKMMDDVDKFKTESLEIVKEILAETQKKIRKI